MNAEYLVIGGDSLVGMEVFKSLKRKGIAAVASTRRKDTLGPERILFDFEDPNTYRVPQGIRHAFVIAAATNYERCENDPLAYEINVKMIPNAIAALLAQNVFVTYISTNSVFGGNTPWPTEDAPHHPEIAYARQKSESEQAVHKRAEAIGAQERYHVIRLTKILDENTPPLPNWVATWRKSEVVTPFADLIFAPMSKRFAADAIVAVGAKRLGGNFHLSGADNVTYVDLANAIASRLGISGNLIEPTTATEKGVHIAFKPRYSGLGMERTARLCGVRPQTLSEVINDVYAEAAPIESRARSA